MKTKFRKRFRLKTFFIRHVFNRFVEIVDEIFKKRVRYDADMLFINDIFFVYFVDMHVNKRQIESKQKLKTIVKTSIKKMRRIEKKTRQTTKQNKQKFVSKTIRFNEMMTNNDIKMNNDTKMNDEKNSNFDVFENVVKNDDANVVRKITNTMKKRDENVRFRKKFEIDVTIVLSMRFIRQIENFHFDIFEFDLNDDDVFETFVRKKRKIENTIEIVDNFF